MTISNPKHFRIKIEDMKHRRNDDGTLSFSEWTGYGPIIVPFSGKVFLKRGTRKPKFTMSYGKRILYIDLTKYLKRHLDYLESKEDQPPEQQSPEQLGLFENIITKFQVFVKNKSSDLYHH